MNVDRLIALVRRELGADEVKLLELDEAVPEGALSCLVPGGRTVVASFAQPIDERDAKQRRLEMLVESFAETLGRPSGAASRPPPAQSLHAVLQGLAQRAAALDALVIDAQSPVVWGAAEDDAAAPHVDNVIAFDSARRTSGERPSNTEAANDEGGERVDPIARRAVDAVRALPAIPTLHRGGHLHEVVRTDDLGWLARSFAGIYVVVLVFQGAFDELRAERAMVQALPTIERLVTALPPLDPTPVAGAAAIRRRRR